MAESVKEMTSKFSKLQKVDFRRWQKKMHFLLTTLNVVHVLSTPALEENENGTPAEIKKRCKWENDDYNCHGHVINGITDRLFDIYQNVESTKELWNNFESKYIANDASTKKFLVSDLLIITWPVMEQYNKLPRILGQFTQHNMKMDECIAVLRSPRGQESDKNKAKFDVGQLSIHMVEGNKMHMTGHVKRDCWVNLNERKMVNNDARNSSGRNNGSNGSAPPKEGQKDKYNMLKVQVTDQALESLILGKDQGSTVTCSLWNVM
ncbi:LOW QUALITY PROTEIN: hypothetical protein OSB04_016327 [Centaurea solstitialis]|uniref:Zinc finger, CCHC-type n=1 Tax=Centaurea solstitialis TaxID=347529 RepID=A0AA38TIW4_9ASTR|nr:LOW QUALITY PROTEIN: hypothetical protein OSB04_016327 [Centaurea solstitialis]